MKERRPASQRFRRDVLQDGANDGTLRKGDSHRRCLTQAGRQASFLTQGRDETEPCTHAEQVDRFATTQPGRTRILQHDPPLNPPEGRVLYSPDTPALASPGSKPVLSVRTCLLK